jgi:hypothetical protein
MTERMIIQHALYIPVTIDEQQREYRARTNPHGDEMDYPDFRAYYIIEVVTPEGEVYRRISELESEAQHIVQTAEDTGQVDGTEFGHYRTVYGSEAYILNSIDAKIRELEDRYDRGDSDAFRDLFKAL